MRIHGLILATLAAPAVALAAPERTADEAAIRALIENVESANNAGDVERWVGLFADDADIDIEPPTASGRSPA